MMNKRLNLYKNVACGVASPYEYINAQLAEWLHRLILYFFFCLICLLVDDVGSPRDRTFTFLVFP